jgi:hypothetical protein
MLNDGTEWVVQKYLFHCTTTAGKPYTTNDITNCAVIVSREDVSHAIHTITPTPAPTQLTSHIVAAAYPATTYPTNINIEYMNNIISHTNISLLMGIGIFLMMVVVIIAVINGGGGGGYGGGYGGGSSDDDGDYIQYKVVEPYVKSDGTYVRGHVKHEKGWRR